ncbi:16S rRNA (cytidine(1402)-2'-O)-methyltransferase [Bertholletia excelsa]
MTVSFSLHLSAVLPWHFVHRSLVFISNNSMTTAPLGLFSLPLPLRPRNNIALSFYSSSTDLAYICSQLPLKTVLQSPLKSRVYLVGTLIGNLEDITLRALWVLKLANVILSEDARHSGKLLHYYNIKTPLVVLARLREGEIVAQISDAGTPGICDPGLQLKMFLCIERVNKFIHVGTTADILKLKLKDFYLNMIETDMISLGGGFLLTTYVVELVSSVVTVKVSRTEGSWKRPECRLHVQLLFGGYAMLDAWGVDGEEIQITVPSKNDVAKLVSMSAKQYKIRIGSMGLVECCW